MKDKMLKLAGVKTDAQFYKLFPDEEAFMKVHGKAFQKALRGAKIEKAQTGGFYPQTEESLMAPEVDLSYLKFNAPTEAPYQVGNAEMATTMKSVTDHATKLNPSALDIPASKLDLPLGLDKAAGIGGKAVPYIGAAMDIGKGLSKLKKQHGEVKRAEANAQIANLQSQAMQSGYLGDKPEREYNRPEDQVQTGEVPIYGVGTNPIARDGYMLQGGGEIQNTYAPNTLYQDLGYEPLSDSDKIKAYYYGGEIPKAISGMSNISGALNNGKFGQIAGQMGNPLESIGNWGANKLGRGYEEAGAQIGKGAGTALGTVIAGPIGGMVGGFAGKLIGGLIDTSGNKRARYQSTVDSRANEMSAMAMGKGIQSQNQGIMEDGGYLNPQRIKYFGDHTAQDVYDFAHEGMDSLRTGGNIRQNLFTQQSMAMGGELQTHWGGHAQPISYNPYLPDGGETVMFRGKSHDETSSNGETGIGVTYGESPVEVEGGEPAVKLQNGGQADSSLVVFGNLKFDKKQAMLTGDEELMDIANTYGGRKFKSIEHDIAKKTNSVNKKIEKATEELLEFTPITSFDKLKLASLKATIDGGNMKLKKYANDTQSLAHFQEAINSTADEHGLIADNLARGEVKIDKSTSTRTAKYGAEIFQTGGEKKMFKTKADRDAKAASLVKDGYTPDPKNPDRFVKTGTKGKTETVVIGGGKTTVMTPGTAPIKDPYKGPLATPEEWDKFLATPQGKKYTEKYVTGTPAVPVETTTPETTKINIISDIPDVEEYIGYEEPAAVEAKQRFPWGMLPMYRPSDQEPLDPNQLRGEMYALSSNQLEPVQAQGYHPQLDIPYDISYQDILNENRASTRAAQRFAGYNPAAQASIAAQEYGANQKVLGEQFRQNQAMKDKVYSGNRNLLNQAQLTNLGIYDKQYERQEGAKSATKATNLAALSSISQKYAQNKLENRTLGAYENLYNYRYGDDMRTQNYNPLAQFNTEMGGGSSPIGQSDAERAIQAQDFLDDYNTKRREDRKAARAPKTTTVTSRNGSIVKAIKAL